MTQKHREEHFARQETEARQQTAFSKMNPRKKIGKKRKATGRGNDEESNEMEEKSNDKTENGLPGLMYRPPTGGGGFLGAEGSTSGQNGGMNLLIQSELCRQRRC